MLIKKTLLRPALRKLSRKHRFIIGVAETATLTGTWWDEGSCYGYDWYDPKTEIYFSIPCPTVPPQFGGGPPPTVTITPGRFLLRSGVFRGDKSTPALTVHPDCLLDLLHVPECPLKWPPIPILCDWLEERELWDWLEIVREVGWAYVRPLTAAIS